MLWRSQTPAGPGSATHVEYDFLRILLDELSARGKHYKAVASVTVGSDFEAVASVTVGSDFEAPRSTPGGLQDIRLTDRDVLLARTDLPARKFSVSNAQAGRFQKHVPICRPVLGRAAHHEGGTVPIRPLSQPLRKIHGAILPAQHQTR
ncbi:hypothetical protein DRB89_41250 [Streptomyces sp. ICC4]|nr:hypothetical protein DRB89_41250 [Streptomyces sp. ICC4]